MSGRPQFDAGYLESAFESIGDQLERPQTVYLIGGGSLALRGLKESTKDIDVVVDSSEAHASLFSALSGTGYDEVDPSRKRIRSSGRRAASRTRTGAGSRFSTGRSSARSSSPTG